MQVDRADGLGVSLARSFELAVLGAQTVGIPVAVVVAVLAMDVAVVADQHEAVSETLSLICLQFYLLTKISQKRVILRRMSPWRNEGMKQE